MTGAERYWGQGFAALFRYQDAATTVVPWPAAGRFKATRPYDDALVRLGLTEVPRLHEVDPRHLRATQPGITRAGVHYYVHDHAYPRLGRTYADQDKASNAFPFIYRRADGQSLILAGHHRCAAALVGGVPVLALVVDGPYGGPL